MRRFHILCVAALVAAVARAEAPSPEYLAKVDQIDPPKYGALLTKHLFVTPGELGRMVWLPSFQGEMVVSVYSTPKPNDGKAEKATA